MELNCGNCGVKFKSHNKNPKYCSLRCRVAFNTTPIDIELVKQLYNEGNTQEEIAIRLGTTQKVIFSRMKKHNIIARVARKRDQRGRKNDSWKGDSATYKSFHARLYRLYGKVKKCEFCETEDSSIRYEWASLNKNYEDITDYARMCKRCHSIYDSIHKNFNQKEVSCSKIN